MTVSAPSLATEVAKRKSAPQKFNTRERQVLASAKDYIDTTSASAAAAKVSDTAYNATSWDSVTTVAPSKNAVRDQVETMLSSISGKQAALTMGQATTGTGGDIGKLTIAGMTATGKVVVTPAEALPTDIAFSHVVAGTGIVTVFGINVDTKAVGAIDSKLMNYIVIALS